MKRMMALFLTMAMAGGMLTACSSGSTESTDTAATETETEASAAEETEEEASAAEEETAEATGDQKEVSILVASADHGWTGAVLKAAEEKADELNADADFSSKYVAKVYAATDSENYIQQLEDIISRADQIAGVATQPYDNGVQSTLEKLSAAGIPLAQFDRIIQSDLITTTVAEVAASNEQIGYKSAQRMLDDGLTTDDIVYILIGDTSSVPLARTSGFKAALTDAGWSDEDIEAVVTESDTTGWSRDTGKSLFESWFGSSACDTSKDIYIFTHDDNLAVGVLESLAGGALDETKKADFNLKAICGCSLPLEWKQVIKGEHATLTAPEGCDVFSVTYDPTDVQLTIDYLVQYLNGESFDVDQTLDVSVIDSTNIDEFAAFDETYDLD